MKSLKYNPKTRDFSDSYKGELFILWWQNHKPSAKRLQRMIPIEWGEAKPSINSLYTWINNDFKDRAAALDKQLADELEARLIREKVEMLHRHSEIGRTMQNKAMDRLRELNLDDLTPSAVVRFLVEGVRIERESSGLPEALEKMINSDDEQILERIEKLTEESSAEILVIEDED